MATGTTVRSSISPRSSNRPPCMAHQNPARGQITVIRPIRRVHSRQRFCPTLCNRPVRCADRAFLTIT